MANPSGTRIDIVVCQKHGLRYNRATDTGCAFCRRDGETAEPPPPPQAAAPPPRPRPAAPTPPPRPAASRATGTVPGVPDVASAAAAAEARAAAAPRPVDNDTCEKHGLRYNRATDKGCVRCRAESGAVSGAARAGASRAASKATPQAPASLGAQLLIAALLVGGTGALFYGAHQAVLESFSGGVLATAGKSGAEAAAAPGEAKYDAPDPAAWPPPRPTGSQPQPPPGMRGRGPAEQQKQIEELFRQMKEDDAKERGEAPPDDNAPQ
jgi:hypothetical protein